MRLYDDYHSALLAVQFKLVPHTSDPNLVNLETREHEWYNWDAWKQISNNFVSIHAIITILEFFSLNGFSQRW